MKFMKFMQIKPQKCRGAFKESMWIDPAWSAEDKFDGDRRIAQFIGHGVHFTGTRESVDGTGYVEKSANIPQLSGRPSIWKIYGVKDRDVPAAPDTGLLHGTVLDGEIVAPWTDALPGGSSKHVTAIMGSSPERAVALQRERGWLEYRVFDCLWFKGLDIRKAPLSERRENAWTALHLWNNKHAKIVHAYSKESEKRRAWETAREGLVFKHEDHTYGNERLWVKLKKEATADVVVMGFTPGKGKYLHSVGAIMFGQYDRANGEVYLRPCGTCSGFDDALRAQFSRGGFKKYAGRVFRIKHNGREPTGAFRHPRFDGWRDDKDPKDCVYDPEET